MKSYCICPTFQNNRNSIPFKDPVDPKMFPKYYEVVKEPMGKKNAKIQFRFDLKFCRPKEN